MASRAARCTGAQFFSRQEDMHHHGFLLLKIPRSTLRLGIELMANVKSISHRCHLLDVALVWRLTKETIHSPLGCVQGGLASRRPTQESWADWLTKAIA